MARLDEELLKANLTLEILRAIKARKLTQAEAGKDSGDPPTSCLANEP
jgi:hypothetical protein